MAVRAHPPDQEKKSSSALDRMDELVVAGRLLAFHFAFRKNRIFAFSQGTLPEPITSAGEEDEEELVRDW